MKLRFIFAVLAAAMSWGAQAGQAAPNLEESRKTAQEFIQKFSDALKQKMHEGGTEAAMEVCKTMVPAMEAQYSKDGSVLRRVSDKLRNQGRATPDDWETRMLGRADLALQNGLSPSTIEFSETRDESDGHWFRYFKAIPVQPMCLQCHGQSYQIPDDIKARLAHDYPDDKATGYSAGALIGGVSIKTKLN